MTPWLPVLACLVVGLFLVPSGTAFSAPPATAPVPALPGHAAVRSSGTPSPIGPAGAAQRPTGAAPATPWTALGGPWVCHGDPDRAQGACSAARLALTPKNAIQGTGWAPATTLNFTPPPQADYAFEMTYDAADGYALLLGDVAGLYGSPGATDAWTYAGGVWTNITATGPPENCPGSALAYDDADGYVVYLGAAAGYFTANCSSAGETWTYRAGTWTQLHPVRSPSPRWGAAMTNDSADGYLLLFGGANDSGFRNDTWTFAAGAWTQMNPKPAPSNRSNAGIAYDAKDGYVVLFGGETNYGGINDTWTFANGSWKNLHLAHAPPVPYPDGFTYDAKDGYAVYTNAYNYSGLTETTWTFVGGAWRNVAPGSGPEQRLGAEQAYDYADGYLLFFGGLGYSPLADYWSFDADVWTNLTTGGPTPIPGGFAAMTFDALDGVLLRVGLSANASTVETTWEYVGQRWVVVPSVRSPPARTYAGLVTDVHDGYVLLFGGLGDPTSTDVPLNDTWEFAGGNWTELTPASAPSPRTGLGLVYDGADGNVLLFGGAPSPPDPASNGGGYTDTWSFQGGTWRNLTTLVGAAPPSAPLQPLSYDASDGYVVDFGAFPSSSAGPAPPLALTYSFVGGTWTNRTATAGVAPPARYGAAVAEDSAFHAVLLFGGLFDPGSGGSTAFNDTWEFVNGSWLELFPAIAPAPQGFAVLADDPGDAGAYLAGASQVQNPTGAWIFTGAGVRPLIAAFTASPAQVDAGNRTTLTVVASEGTAPLTYQYLGLPPGCASANLSTLPCVPAAPGNYSITANVSDPLGNFSRETLVLLVVPAPAVSGLSAAPAPAEVGSRTLITTTVTGGTAPYAYAYAGLPMGCASQTVPALPCTPSAAGNYSVQVTVRDAFNRTAAAAFGLKVLPVGGNGTPTIAGFGASPAALILGNSTNFTAVVTTGTAWVSLAYAGLPPGCASANTTTLPCTPTTAGTYTVTLTATDALGNASKVATALAVYPVQGGGSLSVSAFAPSRPTAAVNETVTLRVAASGGVGALTYAYAGLPPGCTSSNTAALACTPAAAGTYRITATVSDTEGHAVQVPLVLVVVEAISGTLVLLAFAPVPAALVLGQTTVLTVNLTGGSGGRTFAYSGLPDGCPGANTPTLPCTPTDSGTFRIGVTVTDAVGDRVNATTVLRVTPLGTVPPASTAPSAGFSTADLALAAAAA
ncbi:MAG TPA: kelch repeat-containing protein, partial [Thermoplasmata archaeon]|nr:kelch repeat-containing protein [Thermoplasmata archaeon]